MLFVKLFGCLLGCLLGYGPTESSAPTQTSIEGTQKGGGAAGIAPGPGREVVSRSCCLRTAAYFREVHFMTLTFQGRWSGRRGSNPLVSRCGAEQINERSLYPL
nr:MAG TPA: hypothetical protein [Caudoviricetes sp.]